MQNLFQGTIDFKLLENPDETKWRATEINDSYSLIPTYPNSHLYTPKSISDNLLLNVTTFRSKGRIPILCWSKTNFGSIWRCAQPKVGIGKEFSIHDETLVDAIRRTTNAVNSNQNNTATIMDCRAYASAMANRARGMGTEDEARYVNVKVVFENMGNIHTIRASHLNLKKFLNKKIENNMEDTYEENYLTEIEATGWLNHLRSILCSSVKLAKIVTFQKQAVIVHCSVRFWFFFFIMYNNYNIY